VEWRRSCRNDGDGERESGLKNRAERGLERNCVGCTVRDPPLTILKSLSVEERCHTLEVSLIFGTPRVAASGA